MVLMVIDHARDFFHGVRDVPTNLATTTPFLFFTRWATHFCAPVFVLLAGTAAYLYGRSHTEGETRRFLLTRGLWMVFLELTVIRFGWVPDPFFRFTLIQVIWALGWSMIALAALSYLPLRAVVGIAVVMIAGHNLLDGVRGDLFGDWGWLWAVLHERRGLEPLPGRRVMISYPLIPWIGVMALGWGLGAIMVRPAAERQRWLLRLGVAATVAFFVLRGLNVYGDPAPWGRQRSMVLTALSFFNCEKYPPSLAFLLMTLGPAMILLSYAERWADAPGAKPLVTVGRVPLFFYVAHLYLLRFTSAPIAFLRLGPVALGPPPTGTAGSPEFGLWTAYAAWIVALAVLYPMCVWYAGYKQRKRDRWWVGYV
jgi:uncharacterized membrane protein